MSAEEGASTKPDFNGKYEHIRSENLEGFMAEIGVPWLVRKMASKSSPNYFIKQEGDKFEMKMVSLLKTKEFNFTIGTEYEETQHDESVYKISPRWEGDKIVLLYEPKEESEGLKPQKHTREINGEEFTLTLEIGDVKAQRFFKKVPS